jgi:hypothetical protein
MIRKEEMDACLILVFWDSSGQTDLAAKPPTLARRVAQPEYEQGSNPTLTAGYYRYANVFVFRR